MLNASDLRERETDDLLELQKTLRRELFGYRMRNHTGQLDDTSLMSKARRDLARIATVLRERDLEQTELDHDDTEAMPSTDEQSEDVASGSTAAVAEPTSVSEEQP